MIKAGSTVKHLPSGEEWYVLGVNTLTGKLCIAGWPPTIALLSDCVLIEEGKGIQEDEREYRERQFGSGWLD